jgi:hypothetical protein
MLWGNSWNPDSMETGRSQNVHFFTQKLLKVFCQFDEFKTNWSVELDDNVNIA